MSRSDTRCVGDAEHISNEIIDETVRQVELWGEQNHPDGTGPSGYHAHIEGVADRYRMSCDIATNNGTLTYRDILLEEVYEALAEEDKTKLREELIQVAAVCSSWIAKIDRGN